jgi:Cu/Zn superoxide dismutase
LHGEQCEFVVVSAAGTVTFTKTDKEIRVQADVRGLTPGKHGIHVHEFGDASSADGMAAGGHFNPHLRWTMAARRTRIGMSATLP